MPDPTPVTEPASSPGQSGTPASEEVKEPASNPILDSGPIDPESLDGVQGMPKKDAGDKPKEKGGEEKKGGDGTEKPEDKKEETPEGQKEETKPPPSDDELLFGEGGEEKPGSVTKGKNDLEGAAKKLSEQFDTAFENSDSASLEKIEKVVSVKPKLADSLANGVFNDIQGTLGSNEASASEKVDALQKLSDLNTTNPTLAENVAKRFFVTVEDEDVHYEGVDALLEAFDFTPKEKKSEKAPEDEKSLELQKKEIRLSVKEKAFDLATRLGVIKAAGDFETFRTKKDGVYSKILVKLAPYIKKGVSIDDCWEDVENSVLKDANITNAKKQGQVDQKTLDAAAAASAAGTDDLGGGEGDPKLGEADNNFLDQMGITGKKKGEVVKRVAKRTANKQ